MKKIAIGIIAVVAVIIFSLFVGSWNWKRNSVERLKAGSQVIETSQGPIEYSSTGSGAAVIISHGMPGGYDQGLSLAKLAGTQDFEFISVSRPGYLRTPLEVGTTYEEQADAFVALMDALNIQKVAVIGVSSGGPAALQFALRHPNRCWGLVMIAGIVMPPQGEPPQPESGFGKIATSDVSMWILDSVLRYKPGLLLRVIFSDEEQRARILDNPENLEIFVELTQTVYPFSLRSAGTINDIEQHIELPSYPLARIETPTLALYGTVDLQVPFAQAEFVANTIPNVELVAIEGGDHSFFITHRDDVWPKIIEFLGNHAVK